jgi:hypothetical protein
MKLSEVFPSKYLKAADLNGKEPTAKIREIKMEEIGQDKERRPVMYFMGTDKAMVLNKTNALTIGEHYGDDMSAWTGRQVVLFSAWVDFGGKTVQALRVRVPTAQAAPGTAVQQAATAAAIKAQEPFGGVDLDDEIPFAWAGVLLLPWALALLGAGGVA